MSEFASKPEDLPDTKILDELFLYERNTGNLFKRDRYLTKRDGKYYGNLATRRHKHGYFVVYVSKKQMMAHRVIWAMVCGEWPPYDKQIDHINRVRNDNRIKNLRLATGAENRANRNPVSKTKKGNYSTRIRNYCNEFHISQRRFAEIVGVSTTTVTSWVIQGKCPRTKTREKLDLILR